MTRGRRIPRGPLLPWSRRGQRRFRTQLARKLNDDIRWKTGAPGRFPDGVSALGFIETICLSLVRRQKRMQPFDTNYGVDFDNGPEIIRRGVQRRGEIS